MLTDFLEEKDRIMLLVTFADLGKDNLHNCHSGCKRFACWNYQPKYTAKPAMFSIILTNQ